MNVYSAAAVCDTRANKPPLIVEPERENPGQSAKHWNIPIVNACLYVISSNVLAVLGFENFSATIIKIPPATKLMTTGPGPNKTFLIALWNNTPSTPAGIIPIIICNKFNDGPSFTFPIPTNDHNRFQNTTTTAKIDPNWITTSKTFALSSSNPIKCPVKIICPVDDTGRNSVNPSTAPMIKPINQSATSSASLITNNM
ncbi:Undecaprenyl-diphosphatase [Bacillus cereus Rock4-2]|nr:Undecaprenyl-diphosphatase [Bacillus cereus Rock4-2]